MFGTNPRYKKGFVESPNLIVNSVFATIQGEGPYAGQPAIFVRLSHCNLACTFCDTEFEKGEKVTPLELLKRIEGEVKLSNINHNLVVVTGGEPLLQDLKPFFDLYFSVYPAHQIQIETAGTVWQDTLDDFCLMGKVDIVCSPKTPQVHSKIQQHTNAWKYIVREGWVSDDDGLPDMPTQPGLTKRTKLARPTIHKNIYVQAVDEQDPQQNKKNLEFAAKIAMKHGYLLSVQIHKLANLE